MKFLKNNFLFKRKNFKRSFHSLHFKLAVAFLFQLSVAILSCHSCRAPIEHQVKDKINLRLISVLIFFENSH